MPRRDNRPLGWDPNARRAAPVERAPPALPPELGVTVTGPALCEGRPAWVAGWGRFAKARASGQVPSPIEYTVPPVGAEDCPTGPPPRRKSPLPGGGHVAGLRRVGAGWSLRRNRPILSTGSRLARDLTHTHARPCRRQRTADPAARACAPPGRRPPGSLCPAERIEPVWPCRSPTP